MMTRVNKAQTVIKTLLLLFLSLTVLLPIVIMLFKITEVDIPAIVASQMFQQATLHSFVVTLTASILSILLAMILAWCLSRSKIKHKNTFAVLLTIPMLIPSISHGMGLVVLLGSNGVLTNLFHLNLHIYGFWGIVMGSILYSFPVAFLMLMDIFQYEDYTPYESAQVLGIPKRSQFLSITFPYLRKPLISVFFATFTLIFTDYGVPLMVGGKYMTLPVYMYNEVIGQLNFGKGAVVGLILILPALVAFLFDLFNRDVGNMSFVPRRFQINPNKARDRVSLGFVLLVIILILLPIVAFTVLTFVNKYPLDMSLSLRNILQAMDLNAMDYLLNSLIIAFSSSLVGAIVSYLAAYCTARGKGKSSSALHLISITTLAIPGLVLGLSYTLTFKSSFLYGTIAILILVNTIHFFASPYLMAYNALDKINPQLEPVAQTLGIKRWRLLKDVILPQTWGTVLEMFSYFFVNCMITISAVSFLSNADNMPISMMIPQFEAQMLLECSSFVSLLILIINIAMKAIIYFCKKAYVKSQYKNR